TSLANYTPLPTSATGAGTITPKGLTVSGITAASKVYDGSTAATLNVSSASLAGVVSGDTVTLNTAGAVGTFTSKDVGTNITVNITGLTLGGAQAGDYSLGTPTTTSNITNKTLTVSIVGNPTKAYDGTTNANLLTSNFSVSGLVTGENITV